ncbi:MAG TPA: hypothetical protein VHY58_00175 [Streptosporangiaceae bacterium]|jgi:hypothetical protein|nr:hypothetical protein [Streptosporangiaceae bacterium]
MRSALTKAITVMFAASTMLGVTVAGATVASASGVVVCPSGDACLYPNPPTAGAPREYYHYGYYNLSGVYGTRRFTNNQTGGAKAYLCQGYDGDGPCQLVTADSTVNVNFTPINSIYLSA